MNDERLDFQGETQQDALVTMHDQVHDEVHDSVHDGVHDEAPKAKSVEPPLPSLPPAGAWRRFLARMFDVWSQLMLVSFSAMVLITAVAPGVAAWLEPRTESQWFVMLAMVPVVLLDGWLLARFGATPGKAMLGVRVEHIDGRPLATGTAFKRGLHVWLRGLALSIPVLNLATLLRQGLLVGRGRPASYDRDRYRVLARPIGWRDRIGFGVATLGLILLLRLAVGWDMPEQPQQIATAASSWTNPETGRQATIGPGWSHDIDYDDDGKSTHRFANDADRAAILFSVEPVGPTPLDIYARTVAQAAAHQLKLEGRFEDFLGNPSWAAENFLDDAEVTRIEVRVLRRDGNYWNMTAVQYYPYRDTDEEVAALRRQLWETVVAQ